jgi:GTP-binding protein HflX
MLVLLNKSDAVEQRGQLETLGTVLPDALCISAKTGMGLVKLHDAVLDKYRGGSVTVQVAVPQADGKVQSFLRANAAIINEEYFDSSVLIEVRIGKNQLAVLKRLGAQDIKVLSS